MLELRYNKTNGLYEAQNDVPDNIRPGVIKSIGKDTWIHALITATLPTGILRLCTAGINIEFERDTYIGTKVIDMTRTGGSSLSAGSNSELSVQISSISSRDRSIFKRSVGSPLISVRVIATENKGETWALVGRTIIGKMSAPYLVGGLYRFRIKLKNIDISKIRYYQWSHEDRVQRYGIADQGMLQMKSFSQDKVLDDWPNF